MLVRAKKASTRKGETPKRMAERFVFPAPIAGWVLGGNPSTPTPASARVLDNWICETDGVRVRGGATKHGTIGETATSMFTYRSGGTEKLFVASETDIYDLTSPADPDVTPTSDVNSQTSGVYSTEQFSTTGGNYLFCANGDDDVQRYDGSSWTAPTITGATSADLSAVWSHASRLWFVEKSTMSAWYLAADSIAGAATEFFLGSVFNHGGALLFGATLSTDTGAGPADKCVFFSTQGEFAVYTGTDPDTAPETWALDGVYKMPRPLGKNSYLESGGDLWVATEAGLISILAVMGSSAQAIEANAISRNIAPYWQSQASTVDGKWEVINVPLKNLIFVSQPDTADAEGSALVMNTQTGAWSRVIGWQTYTIATFSNSAYFANDDGNVFLTDNGGSDNSAAYSVSYIGQFDGMGAYGQTKTAVQARPLFRSGSPFKAKVSVLSDFNETLSAPPASPDDYATDTWDNGDWDVAVWDASFSTSNSASWRSVAATGFVLAPAIQMTFGITPTPDVSFASMEVEFTPGAGVS